MKNLAELHKKALAVSKSRKSCNHCYYDGHDGFMCLCPFGDGFMEEQNMDPCYEGVLIHLAQQDVLEAVKKEIRNGRPE